MTSAGLRNCGISKNEIKSVWRTSILVVGQRVILKNQRVSADIEPELQPPAPMMPFPSSVSNLEETVSTWETSRCSSATQCFIKPLFLNRKKSERATGPGQSPGEGAVGNQMEQGDFSFFEIACFTYFLSWSILFSRPGDALVQAFFQTSRASRLSGCPVRDWENDFARRFGWGTGTAKIPRAGWRITNCCR